MKTYDFDKIIERRGTGAIKTDALGKVFGKEDLVPLWVADMDFETPDFIVNALKDRLEHPVFGYTAEPEDYRPAIIDWIAGLHGWEIRKEWISYIPGIVKGIGMAINALLEKDEKVIIQPPVYHPFRLVPQRNGRACSIRSVRPSTGMKWTLRTSRPYATTGAGCSFSRTRTTRPASHGPARVSKDSHPSATAGASS